MTALSDHATELMEYATKLALDVYSQPEGGAGGGLHIVLDDCNIEDDYIQSCIDRGELTPVESECARAFLSLSYEQREDVLDALPGGYPR